MLIHVTAEDIAKGIRHCSRACALAVALNRQTGHLWMVDEGKACRLDGCDPPKVQVRLPKLAMHFVRDFDLGIAEPTNLDLPIPA